MKKYRGSGEGGEFEELSCQVDCPPINEKKTRRSVWKRTVSITKRTCLSQRKEKKSTLLHQSAPTATHTGMVGRKGRVPRTIGKKDVPKRGTLRKEGGKHRPFSHHAYPLEGRRERAPEQDRGEVRKCHNRDRKGKIEDGKGRRRSPPKTETKKTAVASARGKASLR